jgi:hypothetical protein
VRVAKLFVSVALSIAAVPAFASSQTSTAQDEARTASIQRDSGELYWTGASDHYYAPSTGRCYISAGQERRHVLISGYHPYEGFEDAVAQEAENAARNR